MMWTALAIRLFAVITVTISVTFQAVKLGDIRLTSKEIHVAYNGIGDETASKDTLFLASPSTVSCHPPSGAITLRSEVGSRAYGCRNSA